MFKKYLLLILSLLCGHLVAVDEETWDRVPNVWGPIYYEWQQLDKQWKSLRNPRSIKGRELSTNYAHRHALKEAQDSSDRIAALIGGNYSCYLPQWGTVEKIFSDHPAVSLIVESFLDQPLTPDTHSRRKIYRNFFKFSEQELKSITLEQAILFSVLAEYCVDTLLVMQDDSQGNVMENKIKCIRNMRSYKEEVNSNQEIVDTLPVHAMERVKFLYRAFRRALSAPENEKKLFCAEVSKLLLKDEANEEETRS